MKPERRYVTSKEALRMARDVVNECTRPEDFLQVVHAAIMVITHNIPSNFRDNTSDERNWERLAVSLGMDAEEWCW